MEQRVHSAPVTMPFPLQSPPITPALVIRQGAGVEVRIAVGVAVGVMVAVGVKVRHGPPTHAALRTYPNTHPGNAFGSVEHRPFAGNPQNGLPLNVF